VKHEEIPGFMSAMTMPYEVSDEKDLAKLSPGTEIRADLVVSGESTRLENIRVIKKNFEEEGTL
jgi:Cu/Ag efflux protein CusF